VFVGFASGDYLAQPLAGAQAADAYGAAGDPQRRRNLGVRELVKIPGGEQIPVVIGEMAQQGDDG